VLAVNKRKSAKRYISVMVWGYKGIARIHDQSTGRELREFNRELYTFVCIRLKTRANKSILLS
jgi:hypothetical protein